MRDFDSFLHHINNFKIVGKEPHDNTALTTNDITALFVTPGNPYNHNANQI